MRAAVALTLALSLSSSGCFATSRGRTIAKATEGGLVIGGIVMLAVVNSGADCDEDGPGLNPDNSCEDRASLLSNIGLGLIVAGLVGFIVTVSTSPEDDADQAPVVTKPGGSTTISPASDAPASGGPATPL